MTLAELLNHVAAHGTIPATRLKDFKTSIRYLAKALHQTTPDACNSDNLADGQWKEPLNHYFATRTTPPSAHTVRNTRNHLSNLFRQAKGLGLLSTAPPLQPTHTLREASKLVLRQTSPYHARMTQPPYRLKPDQWPADVWESWLSYRRQRGMKVRKISLDRREELVSSYLGFIYRVEGRSISSWQELFDAACVDHFVRWHSQRMGVRLSRHAQQVAQLIQLLAAFSQHAEAEALQHYYRDLPVPEPMHDKRQHWFTLRELDQLGLTFLEDGRRPLAPSRPIKHPGLTRATRYQQGLILRLMVRVPLRARNFCEMLLNRNLYEHDGAWHLEFKGDELKVNQRQGRLNSFHLNLQEHAPDIIPTLSEFLHTYRPKLPNADVSSHVFLTHHGIPFCAKTLRQELSHLVYHRTNKRFYPHLIRTIWATEFIDSTGDFTTAAYMLNDRVQTVFQRYQVVLEKTQRQKASSFLSLMLR
jgi:hypothetical protein